MSAGQGNREVLNVVLVETQHAPSTLGLTREAKLIGEYYREMVGQLEEQGRKPVVKIKFHPVYAAQFEDLAMILMAMESPHLVHFMGHGTKGDETKGRMAGLVFQNANRDPVVVGGDRIGRLLAQFPTLIAFFANACESDGIMRSMFKAGMPEGLSVLGAIASTRPINDDVAIRRASMFYAAVAVGYSMFQAYKIASNISTVEDLGQEGVNCIISSTGDEHDLKEVYFHIRPTNKASTGSTSASAGAAGSTDGGAKLPPLLGILNVGSDNAFADHLRDALSVQVRKGNVRLWSPDDIEPGSNLQSVIEKMLAEADVYLPIVSANLMARGQQLTDPMERFLNAPGSNKKLVAIYAKSTDLDVPWLNGRTILPRADVGEQPKALNIKGDRDEVFAEIAAEIAKVVKTLQ